MKPGTNAIDRSVGFGYPWTGVRIEHRPKKEPYTRDELLEILDTLHEAGIKAWWYSVSAKGAIPIFRSKVMPYHPKAVEPEEYRWLVEQAHARGIALFSWEFASTAPLLMAEHPDWRMRFIGVEENPEDGSELRYETDIVRPIGDEKSAYDAYKRFACCLSPYGALLKEFCVEIFNELKLDGIWFDGVGTCGPGVKWGCICPYCAKRFKDDTGVDIPREIDWSSRSFKEWVKWRHRIYAEYWTSLIDHVHDRCDKPLIVFKDTNRRGSGASAAVGGPLMHLPVKGIVGTEISNQPYLALFQTRALRAVSDIYPPEIWRPLLDASRPDYPSRPDPDPAGAILNSVTCMTGGGFASYGIGLKPRHYGKTLKALTKFLEPRAPYVGDSPVLYAGIVASVNSTTFAYADNSDVWTNLAALHGAGRALYQAGNPPRGQWGDAAAQKADEVALAAQCGMYHVLHDPVWLSILGMHNILTQAHVPAEVILDNQLTMEFLGKYPVVVLPDVICLSKEAARTLETYVREGGHLVVTGITGIKDEYGKAHAQGVLDSLLGIVSRDTETEADKLLLLRPATDLLREGLPEAYAMSGKPFLVESAPDAEILARAGAKPETVWPGVTRRSVGKGTAIYIAANVGAAYAISPHRRTREVIRRLLRERPEPFTVEAPPTVAVTAWDQPGRRVFHLLNQPNTMCVIPRDEYGSFPEDVAPTGPVTITIPQHDRAATAPFTDEPLTVEHGDFGTRITLNRLEVHQVIVVTPG